MAAARFDTPLRIEEIEGGEEWRLLEPLVYETGGLKIEVPAGATTDFASIPRCLWNILPPTGRHNKAAVLHDYLYRTRRVARVVADGIFMEAMTALGVPRWRRWIMYLGVRLGGGRAYRRG